MQKQIVPREVYIERSIERVWPSGKWDEVGGTAAERNGPSMSAVNAPPAAPPPTTLTVIGNGDEKVIIEQLAGVDRVILGRLPSGRGGERQVENIAHELGIEVSYVIAPFASVESVLCVDIDSPVLLIGNGQRVKQAKSWLARAKWKREVIECA